MHGDMCSRAQIYANNISLLPSATLSLLPPFQHMAFSKASVGSVDAAIAIASAAAARRDVRLEARPCLACVAGGEEAEPGAALSIAALSCALFIADVRCLVAAPRRRSSVSSVVSLTRHFQNSSPTASRNSSLDSTGKLGGQAGIVRPGHGRDTGPSPTYTLAMVAPAPMPPPLPPLPPRSPSPL